MPAKAAKAAVAYSSSQEHESKSKSKRKRIVSKAVSIACPECDGSESPFLPPQFVAHWNEQHPKRLPSELLDSLEALGLGWCVSCGLFIVEAGKKAGHACSHSSTQETVGGSGGDGGSSSSSDEAVRPCKRARRAAPSEEKDKVRGLTSGSESDEKREEAGAEPARKRRRCEKKMGDEL